MDEILKIAIILVVIVACGVFASWDPSSILGPQGSSGIKPKNLGLVDIRLNVSSIDWDPLAPGESNSTSFLITNVGNMDCCLNMTVGSWDPVLAESYISFLWDQEGTVVPAQKSVTANLTVTISQDCLGVYGWSCIATIWAREPVTMS